jgi:hypothetical protein
MKNITLPHTYYSNTHHSMARHCEYVVGINGIACHIKAIGANYEHTSVYTKFRKT